MMRLTRGAISFLLAEYKAVFRRSYFKGLALAVGLTAGLAAGSAQAYDYVLSDVTADDAAVTIKSSDNLAAIVQKAGTQFNGTLTINGFATSGHFALYGNSSLEGDGELIINGTGNRTFYIRPAYNGSCQGSTTGRLDIGKIDILGGTVSIQDFAGNSYFNSTVVTADEINRVIARDLT